MSRARWAAQYREFRTASALWSRFFNRFQGARVGVPTFVKSAPDGDECRLLGDVLRYPTDSVLAHDARMYHLRSLPAGRLP